MKKNIILLSIFSLLFMSCGSDYPSSPEEVLKKGIEAIHDNDIVEVNRFFYLGNWNDVKHIKLRMKDDDGYLPDRIEIIEVGPVSVDHDGNERCSIHAKTTRRDGFEEVYQYTLEKSGSGKWKISPVWGRI